MEIKQYQINGLRHQVYFWGDKGLPKLFFFHGWMDTGAGFQFIAEHLQEKFHCVALDFRGFGRSEHGFNPLGYFFYDYLADVHELFQQISPDEKIKCIGHSMGGNVLSMYAGSFPERISHFANLEGLGIQDMPFAWGPARARAWIEGEGKSRFRVYPDLEGIIARLRSSNPILTLEQAKFLIPFIAEALPEGYVFSADPKHKSVNPQLFQLKQLQAFWEKIQAKCLIVIGENSVIPSWAPEEGLVAEFTRRSGFFPENSQRVLLKNCGHMMHYEKPEELARLFLDFF